VFSQRAKQEQEQLKQDGGMKTEELDMLRLQIMDRQAKLDAAQKTTYTYKDTIKEQNAHITVLQNEITTLRSAIVDEAAAADEAAQRREADEEEIRQNIQLDVRDRSDARRALFGGAEPSELDSAFTDSLGTMFEAIEDADHQLGSQESLLNNMNSLMDVQQVSLLLLWWWWSLSFQREIAGAVCVVLLVLCCCCFFFLIG
jgi:chromosome segregation ATPase